MYCIHCGTSYPDNATYCPQCGRPVQTTHLHDAAPVVPSSAASGEATILGPSSSASWHQDLRSSTRWIRRVGVPLAALAWIGLVLLILWLASHVARSLILLAIAAILAFALAPAVKLLQRFMPRSVAILVVYIIVFGAISAVCYFLIKTATMQVTDLKIEAGSLLKPNPCGPPSPLQATLQSLGIDATQLQNARQTIVGHLGGLVNDAVPFLRGVFDFVVDIIVVAMLSIYLLLDGSRVPRWLRENMPLAQQKRGFLLLDTLETVVGGYIRGQLALSLLIGVLVGGGMAIFRVPHPILLGEIAFLLAFVPVLGTFISGALCIALSLTASNSWVVSLTHQTWVLAVIVLLYFIAMHAIESHIVGPRIVGRAVGLHPIVSITALIAGTELFGILGALFVAPVVGLMQAIITSVWREWRAAHPDQFPKKSLVAQSQVSNEPAPAAIDLRDAQRG